MTAFTNAIAAQKQGGPTATAAKQVAQDQLVSLLRQDALYVQTVVQEGKGGGRWAGRKVGAFRPDSVGVTSRA